jgi:Holliday junction resolvase
MSRDKGAQGERDVVKEAAKHEIRAIRTAQLQANRQSGAPDVLLFDFPDLHIEVKRDERMSVDAMVRQAATDATDAGRGGVPMVFWRRNKGEWRADVPLPWLLNVLKHLPKATA